MTPNPTCTAGSKGASASLSIPGLTWLGGRCSSLLKSDHFREVQRGLCLLQMSSEGLRPGWQFGVTVRNTDFGVSHPDGCARLYKLCHFSKAFLLPSEKAQRLLRFHNIKQKLITVKCLMQLPVKNIHSYYKIREECPVCVCVCVCVLPGRAL